MTDMMEAHEPRAAAGLATSFRQQVWLLALSRRWIYAVAAGVSLTFVIGRHGAGPSPLTGTSFLSLIAAVFVTIVGSIWPLVVWFGETPARRQYHWSLPVPRPAHDLARVAAGAVHLIAISALIGAVAVAADGTLEWFTATGPQAWLGFFFGPLILYFLVMPLTLWSDYSITRWFLGALVAFLMLATALDTQGFGLFTGWIEWVLFGSDWALTLALLDSVTAMGQRQATIGWWKLSAAWLGFGLAWTLFTAAYRPDDIRRAVRRTRLRRALT